MRIILIISLAIGLFFLSTTAEGANWKFITKNDLGDMLYIDTESIRHISKTVVRAWNKIILKNPKPLDSKEIVEMLGYDEHDCVERKLCYLQMEHKYSDGTTESTLFPVKEWRYVRPDTIESVMHNYLCKSKK